MSRATLKAIQAAAGNAGEAVYVDDVFSTYLYTGTGSNPYPVQEIAVTGNSVTSVTGLAFKSDGTKMYATSGNSAIPGILEFDLSTAWDITTATYNQFGTTFDWCSDIWIDSTGTKVFVTSTASDHIGYYTLSTAWDISTISSRVASRSTTGEGEANPQFIFLKPDGTELYYGGTDTDSVFQLGLSPAFDLSTASHDATFSVASQETLPFALFFNSSGTRMFVTGNGNKTFYQYNLSTGWDLSSASYNSSCTTGQSNAVTGMTIADGKVFTSYSGVNPPEYKAFSIADSDEIVTVVRNVITNGIDLAEEGGLVWTKGRNAAYGHMLFDTERGTTKRISTNDANSQITTTTSLTAFNSNGFDLGSYSGVNNSTNTYASWTFRKQPGFFDIVTWTGDGSTTTHSHNLGSTPAVIIVKRTDSTSNWSMYHRDAVDGIRTGEDLFLYLNTTAAASYLGFPAWSVTDSTFTTTGGGSFNASGGTYVAYLFADNAQDFGTNSNESIIKCGSFTATQGVNVELGFEPQWIMVKSSTSATDWYMFDNMRGWGADQGSNDQWIYANASNAEVSNTNSLGFHATGFTAFNAGAETYIYIAIRRPHKPAKEFVATDLFDPVVGQTSGKPNFSSSTGVVDALFRLLKTSDPGYPILASRLTSPNYLITSSTAVESTFPSSTTKFHFAMNDGWGDNIGGTSTNVFVHMLRRAPGFFDVVVSDGASGGYTTINHNLGVAPELAIVKVRDYSPGQEWYIWVPSQGVEKALNFDNGAIETHPYLKNFTSTTMDTNLGGGVYSYIYYLFATVAGISKVGTYSGTGSDVNVNCGFTSGARFVLVKRTDSTGDWYLWDSANGITAGNDPYILLNSSAGQTTGTDYIDPLSSGFTITSTAPAALNASGGNYIFLAIA